MYQVELSRKTFAISSSSIGSLPKCVMRVCWYCSVSTISYQVPIDLQVIFDLLKYLIDLRRSTLITLEIPTLGHYPGWQLRDHLKEFRFKVIFSTTSIKLWTFCFFLFAHGAINWYEIPQRHGQWIENSLSLWIDWKVGCKIYWRLMTMTKDTGNMSEFTADKMLWI